MRGKVKWWQADAQSGCFLIMSEVSILFIGGR